MSSCFFFAFVLPHIITACGRAPRDESISLETLGAPLVSPALPSVAKGTDKV